MLAELAELSHDQEHCQVIFAVLEYRIRSPEHKWRCVYKALQVMEYLLQRGSAHCCAAAQELVVPLAALQNFTYFGLDQKDYGQNVRLRSEAVKSLILDTEGLAQKRAQLAARAADMKFAGYSRQELAAAAAGTGNSSAAAAVGGPGASAASPPGRPATPPAMAGSYGAGDDGAAAATALAAPGSLSEGPSSPSVYRPPSLFVAASSARMGSQSSSVRGAGETKGVTFEQNRRRLEQLRQLTLLEGNRTCADCASAVAAARPTWASINLGVFICMRCAGIHRGLGVHISKVRSTTLDTWLPEQVATMARLGNRRANAYFEAGLDPVLRPARDNTLELERFIRLKYADKVWAAKGPWPPEEDAVAVAVAVTHESAAQFSSTGKQPNGSALHSPSPSLTTSCTFPEPAVWPSSWAPVAGSTGGGFGDAPPAWPSPTSSITPPSSSQPTRTHTQQQEQQQVSQLGTLSSAPGLRSGVSSAPIRLLPPPPPSVTPEIGPGFGAAAAAGPAPSREGGVMSGSSTDLLQLDSDSEDDGDDGGGGGAANAPGGAAGGPGSGAAALWDLLDPTLDVMTWLDRVEGAQQQQQQQQPPPLPQQQPIQRPPSAPVISAAPAVAAPHHHTAGGPATAAAFPSLPAVYPHFGTPPSVQAAALPLGGTPGIARAGTTPGAGPVPIPAVESIIMTAEFPVYELLTPLPTGGGAAAPPPPPPAAAAGQHTAIPRHFTTPSNSFSQTYPPVFLHHPAPHSAPALQRYGGGTQPIVGGSAAALPSSAITAAATTTAVATPPSNAGGLQQNHGVQSAGMARGGSGVGVGMRGGGAQAAPAAATPGPPLDLDNLLAMQLDSLGSSLAGAPNGSASSAAGGGRQPSWKPAAAVGSAFGGVGGGRR